MGPLRRALPDYLAALDDLPGFLCTLAVDKRLPTLFGPQEKSTRALLSSMLKAEGLGSWKPNVAEKLLRIVHFTAFLTALLAHDGQKIFWMTDNDAVSENGVEQLLAIFRRVLSIYRHPDSTFPLVAGSVEPCIPIEGSTPKGDHQIKSGADCVLRWLGRDGVGLKKANFFIRRGAAGAIESGAVYLESK